MDIFNKHVAKYACGCDDAHAEESANMAAQRLDEMSKMLDSIKAKMTSGAMIAPWQLTHIESVFNDLGDVYSSLEADDKADSMEPSSETIILKASKDSLVDSVKPIVQTAVQLNKGFFSKLIPASEPTEAQKIEDYALLQKFLQQAKDKTKVPALDVSAPVQQTPQSAVPMPQELKPAVAPNLQTETRMA
jgi:hypothetical protein